MTRTLVTGGAGFIGSHLVERLLADGHEVVVVDDLTTGRREQVPVGCLFVQADVAAPELVAAVEQARPEVVLHLAAQMDVRKSVADPLADARTNVLGTVNVLTAAARVGVRKVVFASSGGTVYGEPGTAAVREDAPLRPASPYGAAKVAGETYLAAFSRLHGFGGTSLALANVYGPRQDPHGEAGVVAIFGRALLEGRPTVVFGDGSAVRDYVHVDDVVDAFVQCLDDRTDGGRFNVGTGVATSVLELHALLAAACGSTSEPEGRDARLGELHVVLDSRALTVATGWTATTSLASGLGSTVDWIRRTS